MRHLILLICLLSVFCCGGAWADDNSLTIDQFQKILACETSSIKNVDITNGQPLFVVKLANSETGKLVTVPDQRRKTLIQQLMANGVAFDVHDNLGAWLKYKFSGNNDDNSFQCSQLCSLVSQGRLDQIAHVYAIDDSNLLSVQMAGEPKEKDVVMPAEIKQDIIDELSRKGVKVERMQPRLDLSFVLPGFFVGVLVLGLLYMWSPVKLSSDRPLPATTTNDSPVSESSPRADEP